MEKYNIKYSCGCVHEIIQNDVEKLEAFHKPTGNDTVCSIHKKP